MTEKDSARGASVEFRDLHVRFGAVEAVKRLNLTVAAGEFLTLLGPSGSGKTTALNALAGFLDITGGDILIDGRSIALLPTEKRNVGMIFQNYSLFPHMSVFDNVAFPLRMRGVPKPEIKERVGDALRLVHLGDHGGRMPSQLSGGQRQRVAFARAIVFEPKVLLMDEPLGALDLKLREHMQLEIKQYRQQIGCTVIYVTHDQSEALTLSDRIVIMNEGEIVQVGTPEEIYDRPGSKFAAQFVGETNILRLRREEGGWRIDELGRHVSPEEVNGIAEAGGGYLSIRPESVKRIAGKIDAAGSIAFPVTIEERVFLGDVIRYIARLEGGGSLTFKEHRLHSGKVLKPGEHVELGFRIGDAVVLPPEP